MKPEGSLRHSQVPATCPYPEPSRSSPIPPHPTASRSILILSSHLRLGHPSITDIAFLFTFPMHCISIVRCLYFRIIFTSFFIAFMSPEISALINTRVPFSLLRIMMFGLLLGMVLSVFTCRFSNVFAIAS